MPFLNSECWIGLSCYSFLLAVTTLVVFLIAHYLSYHVHNFVNAVGLIHGFNLSCMNLFLHYSLYDYHYICILLHEIFIW